MVDPSIPLPVVSWDIGGNMFDVPAIPLLTTITLFCTWNESYWNGTDYEYDTVGHFHFIENDTDIGLSSADTKDVSQSEEGVLLYQCQVAIYLKGESSVSHSNYSEILELEFGEPCKNDGKGHLNASGLFCICTYWYSGDECEMIQTEVWASQLDTSNESSAVASVNGIFTKANGFVRAQGTKMTSSSAEVVSILTDKIESSASWSTSTLLSVTDSIMGFVDTTFHTVKATSPRGSGNVYDTMEDSLFTLSSIILNSNSSGENGVEMQAGNITMNMNTLTSDHPSIQARGATIQVSDTGQDQQAFAITYETSPYLTNSADPNGKVVNFRVKDANGALINVTSEPVTLTFSQPTTQNEFNPNISHSYNISLHGVDSEMIFVVEMNVSVNAKLTIQARIDDIPRADEADVNVKVTNDDVQETRNDLNVNFVVASGENVMAVKMYGKNITSYGNFLIVFLRDDTGRTEEVIVSAYTLAVLYWDASTGSWIRSDDTNATEISEESGLRFTSNIFGSFSVSSFFIAPVPIDFEDVFNNFTDNLENSPYVLVLVCLILSGLILGVILLRRQDKQDALLWTYLPLVDNDPADKWLYTISVFTSISSPKRMSSTPFFVLYGEYLNIGTRVLHDGVRMNFGSGTVSNFVMTSSQWLGDVMMVKLWMDGQGDHPDWCLERVVVVDVATSSRYVFLCRDWFSLLKSGTLCHTLPPLQKDTLSAAGVSLVSRERLYEEHIWLSMAKRPSYSIFTRVQRLVVATSLLSLTMLTNAMFFDMESQNSDEEKPTGLRIGPITISYKQFYVGMVSGFIVLLPSVLLAWIFTNIRKKPPDNIETDDSTSSQFDSLRSSTTSVSLLLQKESRQNAIPPRSTELRDGSRSAEIFKIPIWEPDERNTTPSDCILTRESSVVLEYAGLLPRKLDSVLAPVETPIKAEGYKQKNVLVFNSDGENSKVPRKVDNFMATILKECERSQASTPSRPEAKLPWYFLYVGYVIAGAVLFAGLFFTFLYSLQWGGNKSLDWLLSLFFSTSSSAFIFEPIKIIVLCVIISYVFTQLVSSSLKDVAPYESKSAILHPLADRPNICPPPDVNSDFFTKRTRTLSLQKRWHEILNSLGVRAAMVVLFGIICLHIDVNLSYRENKVVGEIFNKTHEGRNIQSLADFYPFLKDVVVRKVIPVSYTNGDPLPTELWNFTHDLAHYRLGPLKVIQFRVQDKCSHDPEDLSRYFRNISCWVDYCPDNEEDGHFGLSWTPCNSSCPEYFSYTVSNEYCMGMNGKVATYGPHGYQVLLNSDQPSALSIVTSLENDRWLDHLTRAVLVELMTFNPNTRLFSQVKLLLETASFGGVLQTSMARSARLYPYVSVWDYFVLLAQLIVVMTVVARTAMLISSCVQTKGKCLLNPTALVTTFELLISWCSICVYIARIHYTMTVLERIVNKRGEFTSLDVVLTLDFVYLVCISTVLFLRMLLFLEPLKLNFYFYIMRQTIRSSLPQFIGYGFLLIVILTAFASFFYLCRGSVASNLKTMPRAYVSLLTVLLGHGKYRVVGGQSEEAGAPTGEEEILFRVMYTLYCFGAAIWMVNIAVTILTSYMAEVTSYGMSRSETKGGYDKKLNAYLWKEIDKLISTVFSTSKKQHRKRLNSEKDQ